MRTFRTTARRTRGLGALGLTAAALLAVTTACGTGDGEAGGSPASNGPGTSAPAVSRAGGSGTPGSAPGDGEPPAYDGTCTDANTDVTMEFARSPQEDDAKFLLVATNIGDQPCTLYHYPVITFGDARYVLPPLKDSARRTPVALEPGQKAYAGLLARQSNKETSTPETTVVLGPPGRTVAPGGTDEGALLQLPGEGEVYVDRMARVTYWQSDTDSAVKPLFAH
ncbi:DUF4232 domain-containing protein [Streptomyces sp. NPDC001770]